jgi:hypothetical protein
MDHFITVGKGACGIGALIAMFSLNVVNQWVMFASTAGGFVVVVFTAISLWYDIRRKRREFDDKK